MTIRSRILRLLKDAPATSPELGSILFPKMKLRDGMRRASAHLCDMRTEGKVKVIGKVNRYGHEAGRIMSNLYAIK